MDLASCLQAGVNNIQDLVHSRDQLWGVGPSDSCVVRRTQAVVLARSTSARDEGRPECRQARGKLGQRAAAAFARDEGEDVIDYVVLVRLWCHSTLGWRASDYAGS